MENYEESNSKKANNTIGGEGLFKAILPRDFIIINGFKAF